MFVTRSNGAELGLLPASADQQEVRVEQSGLALAQPGGEGLRARVPIAQKLHERLMDGVGRVRVSDLGLYHYQRDPVDEKHDVRDDRSFHASRCLDAELVDGVEDVALRVGEVDQLCHRVGLAGEFVHIHLRLEQQLLDVLIGFEQRSAGVAQQLVAQVVELALSEPFAPVWRAIERADRVAEQIR